MDRRVRLGLLARLLAVPLAAAGPAGATPLPGRALVRPGAAGPASPAAAPTGCVADWYVSYGGTSSWLLVHTDTEDLPITDLQFSRSYNDPTDLSHGYLDFNRDGRSDVFSAVPIGGSLYRWRYVAPGPGITSTAWSDWNNLAYDSTPPDQLRFGDFNGDGYTDVFSVVPTVGGFYQWRYSSGGIGSYTNLAFAADTLDQLRFGDFNGDGRTDVFALHPYSGDVLAWDVSYSGTTSYSTINYQTTILSDMQFGDIDGNGHTDVFTTLADGNHYDWEYSPNGSGAYQVLATRSQSVHEVLLAGNFDPPAPDIVLYHGTDIFYTTPRVFDGTHQWWDFFYKPSGPISGDTPLAYDLTPPDQLRFADFNGDGVTDVFKLQQRCTEDLPLVER